MGSLIWNELSRYVSLTASVYAVWASFWGLFFRKFFWDFVGGILRNPGGLQPSPKLHIFIVLIVDAPVVQILTMITGFFMISLEYPVHFIKGTRLHRSLPLRAVLLVFQSFLAVLFYQGTNASLWSLIAALFYVRALTLGEGIGRKDSNGRCFETARSSGDLLFFPSEVHKHYDIGVEFELRLCVALQKKPVERTADGEIALSEKPIEKKNPFAPPYQNPKLHVGDLSYRGEDGSIDYAILLNKYSVVPHHFLLVTKEFRPQTFPLLPQDLAQTYQLLLAARQLNKHYIAFYNCGSNSGASQAHKHVQFIEVEADGPPIEKLARKANLEPKVTFAGKPFALPSLPYANHVFRLPVLSANTIPTELSQTLFPPFLALLDLVISTVRYDPDYPPGSPSYNVVLTLEHMYMIPRRYETYKLEGTQEFVSINSLGFAGMLLARTESELVGMRREGIGKILRGVGLESVHELQVAGTSLEVTDDPSTQ
ncbi:ATP adenylyltransferase-domain-containing protein [Phlebopus sp. FC_14]|nr:ATP adenylyltransferase-domain-containing protein [Phlebopus sp. FC_14]